MNVFRTLEPSLDGWRARPPNPGRRRHSWRSFAPGAVTALIAMASTVPAGAQERPTQGANEAVDARLLRQITLDGEHPLDLPSDLDDAADWRTRMILQIRVALGICPEWPRTPLSPVIHGSIERAGYTVQKVFFESLPGHFVTGNLYRPIGSGESLRPGILSPHGHWKDGRLYHADDNTVRAQLATDAEQHESNARYPLQARCAQLARLGAVVFHYDMVGYADSTQIRHGEGFLDHTAQLWAQSAMGLQTWNSIRALDFLESLPDVDKNRLGATGASGGGTQTFMLAALDDRVRCAVPAVMASTRMQGGCTCENASHLRVGTSNIEFCALIAPRPLFLIGANDWTVAIEERGLPELRAFYTMLGAPDQLGGKCHPEFDHNYNQVSRTHMTRFMARHLDFGPPRESSDGFVEAALDPIAPPDLSVFDADHPRPTEGQPNGPDSVRSWMMAAAVQQQQEWMPTDTASLTHFQDTVGGALRSILHRGRDSIGEPGFLGTRTWELGHGVTCTAGSLLYGDGARPALLSVTPEDWNGTCIVEVVLDLDISANEIRLDNRLSALTEAGAMILRIAPLQPPEQGLPRDGSRHDRFAGYTFGYNPTLLAYRIQDIVAALKYARSLTGCSTVRLIGESQAGPWAILAAAVAGPAAPDRVAADYRAIFEEVDGIDHTDFLPGALRWGGMAHFTGLLAPNHLRLGNTDRIPRTIAAAYRSADAIGHVNLGQATTQTLVEYLLESDSDH